MNKVLKIGLIAGGLVAAGALAGCASRNSGRTPEDVARRTIREYDSGLPFTNGSQLDVNWESRREDRDWNGALRGWWEIGHLLRSADMHVAGESPYFTGRDRRGDSKATYEEIVQVVRSFDFDASGRLSSQEARDFDRTFGPVYYSNWSYDGGGIHHDNDRPPTYDGDNSPTDWDSPDPPF